MILSSRRVSEATNPISSLARLQGLAWRYWIGCWNNLTRHQTGFHMFLKLFQTHSLWIHIYLIREHLVCSIYVVLSSVAVICCVNLKIVNRKESISSSFHQYIYTRYTFQPKKNKSLQRKERINEELICNFDILPYQEVVFGPWRFKGYFLKPC